MEVRVRGWPEDGPTLSLDHRAFSYAGKFVMSDTGKAVASDAGTVVGAVAFSEDRTDASTLRIRYVTVRRDRRGEGIGPRLAADLARRARDRGYGSVLIAVNNPFAFEAMYKAGFGYVGEETGIAELVLSYPRVDGEGDPYRAGLSAFLDRSDLSDEERRFVEQRRDGDPPGTVDAATVDGTAGAANDSDEEPAETDRKPEE